MAENVTDHRLNTRTVMMGSINRFLYLNMNYHVEHHMFTMIPYYKLPAIRELIKQDLP
jgi:fatty acid desaturase